MPRAAGATVLACGAFLKNRACRVDGDRAHWSALHGDLDDGAACEALADSVEVLLARSSAPVQAVAHDLHPDFHSTRLALALAERLAVPAIAVQHHHAHVGVVLAEQGMTRPVIGLALDGVGLGSDGLAWGGELLWVDRDADRWHRIAHLAPLALPGGDIAAREPWRLAAAVLFAAGRGDEIEPRFAPQVGSAATRLLHQMLQRGLNCPRSTGAGRWFDAAAGALGLSLRQSTEAEAAIALERAAHRWLALHPGFDFDWPTLDLQPLVAELFALREQGGDGVARGAAMFHLGLAGALVRRAVDAARHHDTDTVVLAGGCLANRILGQRLRGGLARAGLRVLEAGAAGCGDAGLALGQAWIAASALAAGRVDVVTAGTAVEA
ncbi:MAG: carbamoyltransferase HypF [Burkholderiaceae bacterium]|nr:carbamoyltransferase HypF [Burkholderiaceae bacterium]